MTGLRHGGAPQHPPRPLPRHLTDLTTLELFLAVVRTGSIGEAGRSLAMTQPAASARMRRFERTVGAPLLHRDTRGTRLTPFGQLVASWVEPVVRSAHEMAESIAAASPAGAGHLRVAASMTVAEYLLPQWLGALRAIDPDVVPTLLSGNSESVAEQLRAGDADIGFIESPTTAPGLDDRVVAYDELVTVVAPSHPWARRAPSAAEVAGSALVTREPGSGTRSAFENAVDAAGLGPCAPPLIEMSSTTAIKAAVIGGMGAAVLSTLSVREEARSGSLVVIAPAGLEVRRSLRAVWPAGSSLAGPAGDLLVCALRAGASDRS